MQRPGKLFLLSLGMGLPVTKASGSIQTVCSVILLLLISQGAGVALTDHDIPGHVIGFAAIVLHGGATTGRAGGTKRTHILDFEIIIES